MPLDQFFTSSAKPKPMRQTTASRAFIGMQRKSKERKLNLTKRDKGDILRARPDNGKH